MSATAVLMRAAALALLAGARAKKAGLVLASFGDGPKYEGTLAYFRARAAQVPIRQGPIPIVDKRFISRMHSLGIAVHVWTIDEVDEMNWLLDLGVDGIMTDMPATLLDVFKQRDLWPKG